MVIWKAKSKAGGKLKATNLTFSFDISCPIGFQHRPTHSQPGNLTDVAGPPRALLEYRGQVKSLSEQFLFQFTTTDRLGGC